ncbi:hypothetical protein K466DRAFT_538573 [Polyporus arcularius HHB13444]|uniref:Uncharacterized protein n=1 Tax=Polyporus arcularius HHB13444 TaxID=1314778 RepID=A0A5C3PUE2_9APHY|nr:hypothetical protein K466DRAFT_538573 [Polyporus arcularius HHB13444]
MGFFSGRRAEDTPSSAVSDDASVVRVIRSRFYGKAKGKERELEPPPAPSPYASPSLAASSASFATRPADKRSVAGSIRAPRTSSSTSRNWAASSHTSPRRNGNATDMTGSRSSTDLITVTLAQRLNELATANSEGLLSDDEYRLLRQNLFERFASGSAVPTEASLVPMARPAQSSADSRNFDSHGRRTSSNFHVQPNSARSPSISSKKSFSSTVTGLLRRATSRRVVSMPVEPNGDTMSVYSMVSSPSERATLPRKLSKQSSDVSLRTETSDPRLSQTFTRRTVIGNHTFSATDPGTSSRTRTRSGSRSAPPSSFHGSKGVEASYTHISMAEIPDDDTVESVQDIRHQIELVEAEGRRLLDAFNGLELSTLTRKRKPPSIPPLPTHGSLNDATWPASTLRPGKDIDALSFKSNGSGRTARSLKRTPSVGTKMRTATSSTTLSSQSAVMRKTSLSSVSSRGRTGPALPALSAHLGLASSSSLNLARSTGHLPLETVEESEGKPMHPSASRNGSTRRESRLGESSIGSPISPGPRSEAGSMGSGSRRGGPGQVDDDELIGMETELADIRRRRAEVTARYESRLEYLRARLKGAELREKILRK